ncbi:hypothetical protein BF33_3723 [Bacillus cereus]|nr:hypothetical protein BG11_3136 [Bacillus cereus]AJK32755.1 hypothetical protein BF33_3723 [Bacillus cereus]
MLVVKGINQQEEMLTDYKEVKRNVSSERY